MNPQPGLTRNVIKRNYAVITPDGRVPSLLPGWTNCTPCVLISGAMGAGFCQYLIQLEAGGRGAGQTGADEWFLHILKGRAEINGVGLDEGGFAFLPPDFTFEVRGSLANSEMLIFRKKYEFLASQKPPQFFTANESDIPEQPFLGDKRARLKTLLPESGQMDMAVNIFTFDPGATLPFVETHVMEHGMFFLSGGGVYRLDNDWHPVAAADALWIAPYCPQWFIAAGPNPSRYIYYKNVNRLPD